MAESLISIAYRVVTASKHPLPFMEVWNKTAEEAGLNEEQKAEQVSYFYTNLILDGRFVNLGDNTWDLRERHSYDKVHIDITDVYSDMESEVTDDEEETREIMDEEKNLGTIVPDHDDEMGEEEEDVDERKEY